MRAKEKHCMLGQRGTDMDEIKCLPLPGLVTHSESNSLQVESIGNGEAVNLLLKDHL